MWLRTSTSTRSTSPDEPDLRRRSGAGRTSNRVAVLAREPDRRLAVAVEPADDVGVDLAEQDHLRHLDRLRVGDAHALDEPDLHPQPLHVAGDVRAAAVDDHRVQADVLEQHDVGGEGLAQLLVAHRGAAVLDHHRAPVELPDVGQRLEQRLDAARDVVVGSRRVLRVQPDVVVGEVARSRPAPRRRRGRGAPRSRPRPLRPPSSRGVDRVRARARRAPRRPAPCRPPGRSGPSSGRGRRARS